MTGTRHRREIARRTLVLGMILALCLGTGIFALGVANGNALRVAAMFVLTVAVGAGLLALDEARVVEARMKADLSRERADHTRRGMDVDRSMSALVRRIDQLEHELIDVRHDLSRAPRSIVIVAQGVPAAPRAASRILEIADVVPSVWVGVRAPADDARPDEAPIEPPIQIPDEIDLRDSVVTEPGANDAVNADDEEAFPIVEVVGEFTLEGLALFSRPAGMPSTFPSVEVVVDDESAPEDDETAPEVVDLRDRQRSHRTA